VTPKNRIKKNTARKIHTKPKLKFIDNSNGEHIMVPSDTKKCPAGEKGPKKGGGKNGQV